MAIPLKLPEQNQVMLTGNLTRDPEVFILQSGTAKCSFSIAVNKRYKDKSTGEWKDLTTYVPIVVWREAAERCKEKLRKGSPVHVEGRLSSRQYEDKKTGQKRTILEVEARRVQFLAKSEGSSGQSPVPAGGGDSADLEEVPF